MKQINLLDLIQNKSVEHSKFTNHKIYKIEDLQNSKSLDECFDVYFNICVKNGSEHTVRAKDADLKRFKDFFIKELGHDNPDFWTPSFSKKYYRHLEESGYKASSINRMCATLRHAARFIDRYRKFPASFPFEMVKRCREDDVPYKGLTSRQLSLLKAAIDIRIAICKRKNQNPILEAAIFYTFLTTGLRKFEVINLKRKQYNGKCFLNVKRKGNKYTHEVVIGKVAIEYIDKYLAMRGYVDPDDYLFVTKNGNQFVPSDMFLMLNRIANQAQAQIPEEERFNITPHMFRHTFAKTILEKKGINYTREMLGNVSWDNVFRYTKLTAEEKNNAVNECFE